MARIGTALNPEGGGRLVRWLVLAYIGLLVLLPLAALAQYGLKGGLSELWQAVTSPGAAMACQSAPMPPLKPCCASAASGSSTRKPI